MNSESIAGIVARQREFFAGGASKDIAFRIDALKKLRTAIQSSEADIAAALKSDLNKSGFESYMTEVGMVLEELRYTIPRLARWARPTRVRTPMAQFAAASYILKEPYGLALVISPWNYPFQLTLAPVIGAIAAGCCVTIKPSAYAPATSAAIARLIGSIFAPEYIRVVEGGREENAALLEEKFDYIFFTGSVSVGRVVMEKAARHLTPLSLELGGKSPAIVDRSADLKIAAKRLAFGKCLNAGQTCVAPDYLYVHASVKDEFLSLYKNAVESFFPDGYADMPVIVNQKHFERVLGLLKGETIFMGGGSDPKTRHIEPTVLVDIDWDRPVMGEEIFGPILPVLQFENLDDVIREVFSRPKPLALYLFTRDPLVKHEVLGRVSFGGGCVNDTIIHLASTNLGFGGVGESGMGAYHGKRSFDTFTHEKSIVDKACWIDLPIRYHPYTETKLKLLRKFMR